MFTYYTTCIYVMFRKKDGFVVLHSSSKTNAINKWTFHINYTRKSLASASIFFTSKTVIRTLIKMLLQAI